MINQPYPWQTWREIYSSPEREVKILMTANLGEERIVIYAPVKGIHEPTAMEIGEFMKRFQKIPSVTFTTTEPVESLRSRVDEPSSSKLEA